VIAYPDALFACLLSLPLPLSTHTRYYPCIQKINAVQTRAQAALPVGSTPLLHAWL